MLPRLENGDGISTPSTWSGPERLDGDRRGQRGVDAARQAEHRSFEAALARVVARAEHERAPDLRFRVEIR